MPALAQWLQGPLTTLGLTRPDGRPLYRYRLADEDFHSLERALRARLAGCHTLDRIPEFSRYFPCLFVLYAAEWWRRRYDGTGWTWQGILQDLSADAKPWAQVQRSACVERGLHDWRLERTHAGGLRYLRAIALQGGLPLRPLAEARGALGRVLRRVLTLARVGTPGPELVQGWVASLSNELPQSYRREEVYELLAEVVTTVLTLVHDAGLTPGVEVVPRLDSRCPDWRERFPLPVGDRDIAGLIEQLIQDAVRVPQATHGQLRVERWLEQDGANWGLCSSLAAIERLEISHLGEWFGVDAMALPRGFQILLETDDDRLAWQARRLTGHNAYRVEPQPGAIGDEGAAQEHRLCLALADGRVWPAPARRGHALDAGLPWVFEERPGGPPRWVREGSGSVTTATALIAVPSGYRVVADAGGSVDLGRLAVLDRRAYRVGAGATVLSPEGQRWRIRTGQADAREPDFHWVGKPVWAGLVDPPLAFEGRPRLYDGLTSIAPHLLSWHPNNPGYFGPAVAALDQGGERLHRARLVVLPAGAAIKVIPSGECGGEMRFDGWGAASASVTQPDVTSLSRRDAGVLILALTWHAAADERRVPPEWVEVTLTWPHNPTPARVRLPFPARGVHAFDGAGPTLPCNAWVPAHRLIGLRLVAVGGSANMVLRLSLRHTMGGGKQVDARIPIHRPANTSRVELHLQDHADHIDRLLAADELLDAWVEATLCDGPQDLFQLRLSRYLCPLERTDLDVRLTQEGLRRIDATVLADLPVHALRLESPGDEPCRLEPNYSEGVPTGAWAFDAQNREPGSWFIYPGTDSQGRFRPTLWVIEGETPAASPLTRALAVSDQVERAEALDEVIAAMAADYCESCWPDLERLAGHLGHLPLSSLDLWRRLAHSPAGMVALALRLHADLADGFVRRFALELPFAWEAVPVRAWQFGAECLRRQCQAWFGETQCNKEFATRLTQALSAVAAACPALDILLGLVRCEALGAQCPEITMLRHPASDGMLRSQLFDGDDCAVQRLLRAHTEEQWPPAGTLTKWLSRERQGDGLIAAIFTSGHPDWRDTVIHLPILLAFQTATSATDGWFKHPGRIHSLRCHRAFDPDWFDEAFARTIARCIARGLLIS